MEKLKFESKELIYSEKNLESLPGKIRSFLQGYFDSGDFMSANTSGSTGTPKSIDISKSSMRASAAKTINFLNLQPGNRCLLCMSPEHIAGMMMLARWIEGDLDLYYVLPSKEPLKEIEGDFDFTAMVPYQARHSLHDLHRIRNLIIGGGPVDPDLEKELTALKTNIFHTYGMTETLSHVAMRRISPVNEGVFKAMQNVEFSIDDRNCLVIHAPDIGVTGLVTNDVVDLIDLHSFKWLGRYDNVVNSGGIKLHPESIERKIGDIGVKYFLAGFPDAEFGEKLIMLVEGSEIPGDLGSFFNRLNKFEIPKEVLAVPQFEYTSNGKLQRSATLNSLFQ